jgi:hypothetical protein
MYTVYDDGGGGVKVRKAVTIVDSAIKDAQVATHILGRPLFLQLGRCQFLNDTFAHLPLLTLFEIQTLRTMEREENIMS